MNKTEQAEIKFSEGYSCSQAIFSTYCEKFNIDRRTALALSAGLGGGICMGKTCGAVTGALLIIGLAMAGENPEKNEDRRPVKQAAIEYLKKFEELNGSTECKELLSTNIATPEGMKKALEERLFTTVCPQFIADSCTILEEIIERS